MLINSSKDSLILLVQSSKQYGCQCKKYKFCVSKSNKRMNIINIPIAICVRIGFIFPSSNYLRTATQA
ncbi:MAG: hypothetical protein ACFFEY_21235 [Candidatus Thorarchaeota archaeon]